MKTIKVSDELHRAIKMKAAERGVTLETFASDGLRYWAIGRFRSVPVWVESERKAAAGAGGKGGAK